MNSRTSLKKKVLLVLFGVTLSVILLEAGLRAAGFIFLSVQKYRNFCAIKSKGAYRVLCIGESTTAGEYPPFLEKKLNEYSIGIKFSVIDCGLPGIDTSYLLSNIEQNIKQYKPDMVVAMIGINDRAENGDGAYIPVALLTPSGKKPFFASLRIYKVGVYLWLSVERALGKIGSINKNKNSSLGFKDSSFPVDVSLDLSEQYAATGHLYNSLGKRGEAEVELRKAIVLNPRGRAYGYLIWLYYVEQRFSDMDCAFREAIKVNPSNFDAYFWMGLAKRCFGEYALAEELFKKANELDSYNERVYLELYPIYLEKKEYGKAEELLQKALKFNIKTARIYGALSSLCRTQGNYSLSDALTAKAATMHYGIQTVDNYCRLWEILKKKGIRLVCVQYPMRSAWPLRQIFPDPQGITFVDNEAVFKNAVDKKSYQVYFRDMVGGDFGHCTPKGNQLLAENIAKVIVKEVFSK